MSTNTVAYYGRNEDAARLPANPKRITQKAVDVFTRGQCHALALALHEKTGLPLVGIHAGSHAKYSTPEHVAVLLPNNNTAFPNVLDIEGPGAYTRWMMLYSEIEVTLQPYTKTEVENFCKRDYLEPNLKAAQPFADLLLKQYGIQKFTPETQESL